MTADSAPSAPSPSSGRERRRWPRRRADWPIALDLPEGRYEARVRDISQAGVCFYLDRPLEMMTTLAIDLDLPLEPREGAPPRTDEARVRVRGTGIVVRCEGISDRLDHYEIAVFMPDLDETQKEVLAEFVRLHPEFEPEA